MNIKIIPLLSAVALVASMGLTTLEANAPAKKPKPFLIQGKLPHLTMTIKTLWDDEGLALTQKQKEKLLVIRKYTISNAQALGKQIIKLENQIVKASQNGATSESLKDDVKKLALLRAEATIVHLKCIYDTKKVLNKKQLEIMKLRKS